MHVLITHPTLLGALVVTNAILRRLTNRRFIIIIIIICNYEIMQATLANTFLFILQDSALAYLRYGGRFYGTLSRS